MTRDRKERFRAMATRLRAAVLESPGETDPALRAAVEHRAAILGGRIRPGATDAPIRRATAEARGRSDEPSPHPASVPDEVPELLRAYVDTVALHAYRVTDEAVEGLREAGRSQDEIFEVTVSAAVGAGLGRLERAYAALRGEV